jgi:hypothetical protein
VTETSLAASWRWRALPLPLPWLRTPLVKSETTMLLIHHSDDARGSTSSDPFAAAGMERDSDSESEEGALPSAPPPRAKTLAGPDAEEEDADADADGIRSAQVAREIYGADARAEVTLKPDGASRGGVRLSALHELVTWVMTNHGANPSRWAFVRNKPLVSRVVMLLAPGIDATRCVLSHTGPHTTAFAW